MSKSVIQLKDHLFETRSFVLATSSYVIVIIATFHLICTTHCRYYIFFLFVSPTLLCTLRTFDYFLYIS